MLPYTTGLGIGLAWRHARLDLNQRPLPSRSSALPLSYGRLKEPPAGLEPAPRPYDGRVLAVDTTEALLSYGNGRRELRSQDSNPVCLGQGQECGQSHPSASMRRYVKCGRQGLNLRRLAFQASALPAELQPHGRRRAAAATEGRGIEPPRVYAPTVFGTAAVAIRRLAPPGSACGACVGQARQDARTGLEPVWSRVATCRVAVPPPGVGCCCVIAPGAGLEPARSREQRINGPPRLADFATRDRSTGWAASDSNGGPPIKSRVLWPI